MIGALIQLGIGQCLAIAFDGRAIGLQPHLMFEEFVQ
jgi:hypothetical protein